MKRGLAIGFFLLAALSRPSSAQQQFNSPEVASAGDAYAPYQIVLDGLFVFDLALDPDGAIQKIVPLRNPGAMLGAAETSLRGWTFKPASREGKPVASRFTAIFVYRPASNGVAAAFPPAKFSPVLPPDPQANSSHGNYVPVGVLSFVYPDYPVNSVAWGSVVVQLTVDGSGDVTKVDFLHSMEGFNSLVTDALKKWRFQPARRKGKPVAAKTVIAFVFQTPSAN
jgi:periplasmic protein TonB